MKTKLFTLIALFVISLASAQDEDDTFRWYYSLGAVINPDFNINENLQASGVHRIADASPMVSVGWSVVTENRLAVDFDLGVATSLYGRKNEGYNFVQVPVSLNVQYVLADREKIAFSAGINGSYTFYDLSVYTKETEIDMNDLDPSANTGYIRLNNQSVYVGPSLAFTFLKHKSNPLKLSLGYDFAVTNSKWEADYAKISNPVKENGGRAYIQLKIPFGTIGKMWSGTDEE